MALRGLQGTFDALPDVLEKADPANGAAPFIASAYPVVKVPFGDSLCFWHRCISGMGKLRYTKDAGN